MMKSLKLLLPTLLILFSFGAFGMEKGCLSEEQLTEEEGIRKLINEWTPEIPCEIASYVMHKNPIVDYICGFVPAKIFIDPPYNFTLPVNPNGTYVVVLELILGHVLFEIWDEKTGKWVKDDLGEGRQTLSGFGLAMEKFLGLNREKIKECVGFQRREDITYVQVTDDILIVWSESEKKARGYDISKVPLEDRERVKDYLNNKLTLKQANLLYAIGKSIEKGEQFHLDEDKERARDLMVTYCSLDPAVKKVLKDHVAINGEFKDSLLPKKRRKLT